MKVFKATDRDMTCTKGHGTFKYELGKTYTEPAAKVAHYGLHVSEYVMEAVYWYPPADGGRIFAGIGEGIDEENGDKISCRKLTLLTELSTPQIVAEALLYMLAHPQREYEKRGRNFEVSKDRAECGRGGIAIARGRYPKARGGKDAMLGLMNDDQKEVRMLKVGRNGIRVDRWYQLKDGEVIECETGRSVDTEAAEAPEG